VTLHVLVEGPSEHAFLDPWLKRLLKGASFKVHPHQGKGTLPAEFAAAPDPKHRGLLDQLPAKLRAFGATGDAEVLVLVDADEDDCVQLQETLVEVAKAVAPSLTVLIRIAVEETEAFYLGDLKALEAAYPDADMDRARDYIPDSICGTWELFGEIIGDDGGNKVAWAEAIGPKLTSSEPRTRSPSFRSLIRGIRQLVAPSTEPTKKQKTYGHPPKRRDDPSRRR